MNLRHLEVFQAVMSVGTTKNAARLLGITQPAVSNMMRQFEGQLGFSLFDRIGGRLRPTLEAQVLSENLERVFASVDAVQSLVGDLRDAQTGTLYILASPSLGQTILPSAITAFVQERSEVRVRFDMPPIKSIIRRLDGHQADFSLTITPLNHPALECHTLRTGRMVCAMPRGHPLARRKHVHARDFHNARVISYPRITLFGMLVDDAFREHNVTPRVDIEVRTCFIAATLVNAGAGIAVVDEFSVDKNTFPNIETRPFKTRQRVTVSLSHAKQKPLSRLARLFIDDYLWCGGGPAVQITQRANNR